MLMQLCTNLSAAASPWSMLQPAVKIVGVAQLANRILAGRWFPIRYSTTPLLDLVSNPPWRLPDFTGEVHRRPLVPARPIRALAFRPSGFARARVYRRVVEPVILCSNPTSPARFKHDLVVKLRLSLSSSVTLARCSIKDFSWRPSSFRQLPNRVVMWWADSLFLLSVLWS